MKPHEETWTAALHGNASRAVPATREARMMPPTSSQMRWFLDRYRDRIPKDEHVGIETTIHNYDDAWTVVLWRMRGVGRDAVYFAHSVDIPASALFVVASPRDTMVRVVDELQRAVAYLVAIVFPALPPTFRLGRRPVTSPSRARAARGARTAALR